MIFAVTEVTAVVLFASPSLDLSSAAGACAVDSVSRAISCSALPRRSRSVAGASSRFFRRRSLCCAHFLQRLLSLSLFLSSSDASRAPPEDRMRGRLPLLLRCF